MESLIDQIIEILSEDEAFVLVTLIEQKGSAPRGVGSKMIVRKNTDIVGTIGGGILEAEDLARVHCPIGLPIHAETPEEIAISIAAELIGARGEKQHGKT